MDRPDLIRKSAAGLVVRPHFADYAAQRSTFSWDAARRELEGLPGAGINIAWEAVERHARGPHAEKVALRWLGRDGATRDIRYCELARESRRFAGVLRGLGVGKGDRVFVLAGRIPELYVTVLGTLLNGSVLSPLFSAFGPEPIRTRMAAGDARVLVTTESLYRRKAAQIVASLPGLRHVLVIAEGAGAIANTQDFAQCLRAAPDDCPVEPTQEEDMALLHFTSGTTGTPKGAIHVHGAVVAHYATGKYALDLHTEDIFWCTADPGWVTGTSYGIIAPLLHGVTSIIDEEDFDAERWYRILEEQRVTVWYTAPTAIRMLMKAGPELARQHRRDALRFVASVGEPLNAEAVWWGAEVLGLPIHDNWWQTETGGIMIANTPAFDIKPGSMGRPLPGIDAYIVQHEKDGALRLVDAPGIEG